MSGQELEQIVQITVEDFDHQGRAGKFINSSSTTKIICVISVFYLFIFTVFTIHQFLQ